MFSENYSCCLNLVFFVFSMFFRIKKKLGAKPVLFSFLILLVFENKKQFSKTFFKAGRPVSVVMLLLFLSI